MLFVVSYGTFCKAPASSGLALDETHVSDDDYTIADSISEEQDSHASSSSLPSPAASAERKQSDTVSLEHKHSDKKKFADLLAHSVGESGSVKNFLSAAPPFRVHETAFIMFRYDHINKVIDDRHFEYIVADPAVRIVGAAAACGLLFLRKIAACTLWLLNSLPKSHYLAICRCPASQSLPVTKQIPFGQCWADKGAIGRLFNCVPEW